MLEKLEGSGHLYGLDVDPIEIVKTTARLREKGFGEEILTVRQMNFAEIDLLSEEVGKFDFVLADLGVSSMQIDNPERGFTYKAEGPLDLRLDPEKGVSAADRLKEVTREELTGMLAENSPERGFTYKAEGPLDLRLDPEKGVSAADRLKEVTREELTGMLAENSDEPYAEEIAREVLKRNRKKEYIRTTTQFKEAIETALGFLPEEERKEAVVKSCKRCFQALRIDVNSEFEVLYSFLEKLPGVMAPGGRAAILTFHSGEDRLVKHYFKEGKKAGLYQEISEEVIRPSAEECQRNPRARSTKMRWAIRAQE